MTVDRVILATDASPLYLPFVRLVATQWQRRLGARPTLAFVADAHTPIDAGPAEVIRVPPIVGVDTGLHAQVIRLLLPALFPGDRCLLSDIDMVPLDGGYFVDALAAIADDAFVVMRDRAYGSPTDRYPICYNAARGATFGEVFGVHTADEIRVAVLGWAGLGYGWHTDERMLYQHLHEWPAFRARAVLLGGTTEARIDRSNWAYDTGRLRRGEYIDAHLPRPLTVHRQSIDALLAAASLGPASWRRRATTVPVGDRLRRLTRGVVRRLGYQLTRLPGPSPVSGVSLPDQLVDAYGTHVFPLAAVLAETSGDGAVLELGMGDYSTPLLHALCKHRPVVSVETNPQWAARFERFRSTAHEVRVVADWTTADVIESRRWSVVLVDCAPATARRALIERLRGRATFVVVHDTEPDTAAAADYAVDDALNQYRHRSDYRMFRPWTTIVSDERPFTLSDVESRGHMSAET